MSLKNNIDKSYEETDGNMEDDNVYEDTMQDQENELNGNKIEYRRKLIEIPGEALPCPSLLSFEASFSPPTQDEVKYYKSTANKKVTVSIYLLLTVLNIFL